MNPSSLSSRLIHRLRHLSRRDLAVRGFGILLIAVGFIVADRIRSHQELESLPLGCALMSAGLVLQRGIPVAIVMGQIGFVVATVFSVALLRNFNLDPFVVSWAVASWSLLALVVSLRSHSGELLARDPPPLRYFPLLSLLGGVAIVSGIALDAAESAVGPSTQPHGVQFAAYAVAALLAALGMVRVMNAKADGLALLGLVLGIVHASRYVWKVETDVGPVAQWLGTIMLAPLAVSACWPTRWKNPLVSPGKALSRLGNAAVRASHMGIVLIPLALVGWIALVASQRRDPASMPIAKWSPRDLGVDSGTLALATTAPSSVLKMVAATDTVVTKACVDAWSAKTISPEAASSARLLCEKREPLSTQERHRIVALHDTITRSRDALVKACSAAEPTPLGSDGPAPSWLGSGMDRILFTRALEGHKAESLEFLVDLLAIEEARTRAFACAGDAYPFGHLRTILLASAVVELAVSDTSDDANRGALDPLAEQLRLSLARNPLDSQARRYLLLHAEVQLSRRVGEFSFARYLSDPVQTRLAINELAAAVPGDRGPISGLRPWLLDFSGTYALHNALRWDRATASLEPTVHERTERLLSRVESLASSGSP